MYLYGVQIFGLIQFIVSRGDGSERRFKALCQELFWKTTTCYARARWTDLMTLLDNQTLRSLANESFSGRLLLLLVVSTNYSNIFKFARWSIWTYSRDGHILWLLRWMCWFSLGFPFLPRKMRKTWKFVDLHWFCLTVNILLTWASKPHDAETRSEWRRWCNWGCPYDMQMKKRNHHPPQAPRCMSSTTRY